MPFTQRPARRHLPALLTTVLLGSAALAACSSGGDGGGRPTVDHGITTSVPAPTQEVASLTWNVPAGEPPTLDPAQSGIESVSTITANLCEGLFTLGPDYKPRPALATGVEHPDPLTYVLSLREDATFWNGDPVTPADVLFSVERILDPKLGSSWIGWAANLRDIKATGEHEITVRLKRPDAVVPNFFAMPSFFVVQKKFAETAGPAFGTASGGLMCTGPYKFGAWTQGQDVTVTRNDAWWNTAAPKVKDIRFTFITDPSAQTAALASGDVDGQFSVPLAAEPQLAGKGRLLFGASMAPTFLSVLNSEGALAEPATRRALQALIDYKGILESVYQGTAQPLRALVPPEAWGYAADVYRAEYDKLPEPAQDLDKAKALVEATPAAKEKIVLAYTTAIDEESRIATAIADAAAQVGMTVELRPLTAEQFGAVFIAPTAREGIDLLLSSGYLDFPEPLAYYQFFTTGHFYNFGGYADTGYDAAIGKAMTTEDPVGRAREVAKAQGIMAADLANIPIATQYVRVFYTDRLTGLVPRQTYVNTPWAVSLGGV
ncbi:peptide/nickel transport system substrate-binding protein [Actinocorallia herbida]|uniref:Peptide/nickel transport system substrate-binding protein n=1 Tax=Actinocorallia herbida TaxID=58109 RepID=A0A3N1CXU5_9ACTN|nr:ABC transporter substrate-binding protein [Actinocorallia herbida]ROO86123.1 peptide/nickel transport system substrate-binding protein [Actinocorallia herbida]